MRKRWTSSLRAIAVVFLSLPAVSFAADRHFPERSWERLTAPEKLGWSREKLKAARDYSATIQTAAVIVIVNGQVLEEWGETATRFNVHSIRKSFLSALYGLPVQEGRINLSATMEQLGTDDNEPSLTPVEKKATVGDLLKARSGIYHTANYQSQQAQAKRPRRGSHAPGTFWYYNNWDFNALGTIFERLTKSDIFSGFKARIADPIGMEDFRLEDGRYVTGPASIHPAYVFRMTARDMARFGVLFLREGAWRGHQIIPRDWVRESTRSYSTAGTSGGYGYMWWIATDGRHLPGVSLPDGSYSARGAGGDKILIVPSFDLVIVHRVNTDIRGRQVTTRQFGELVGLILQARNPGTTKRD